uniref:MHC class II beta chain N-terminal domain-containing protein n=1 Tax=Anas platyrhynchos platyrhynchos TaxID=8840 RepID=A0A493SVH7_ANAPP
VARDKCQRVPSGVRFCLVTGDAAQPCCSLVVTGTPRFFHYLTVDECQYLNGTERVRYLYRDIYNQQQNAHFDSNVGHFVADTELGKPIADDWNNQPKIMEDMRARVDTFCRYNYFMASFTVDRRGACTRARGW